MTQSLELLAPAGNAEIGFAAIDHGADAVYVGAPRFSARANAGVEIGEIERLIQYAHLFYARVYVALNTILTDKEVQESLEVIQRVYELGADGLIIQDFGLLESDLPPIPLIASTQMHNNSPDRIGFLESVGFKRAILARELGLEEIAAIRKSTRIELECFVHGALCVSYSGRCYMSQAVTGRSGNRGVCAQPCRSRYTLTDGNGDRVLSDKYLLSLKDLNLMNEIPTLAAAGITSFKIEGRYKEIDYVKNVTAAYGQVLDRFILKNPGYCRSSSGRSKPAFTPDTARTFNRGFTRYLLSGRKEKVASLDTPKSLGQAVGAITELGKGFFRTDGVDLNSGDGLCFFTRNGDLQGFRVERVENRKVFPNTMNDLKKGTSLYRNHDAALIRLLKKTSGGRRISVGLAFSQDADTARLVAEDEDGNCAEIAVSRPREEPRDPSAVQERLKAQLASTGDTPFRVTGVDITGGAGFYPISFLNNMKRNVLSELARLRLKNRPGEKQKHTPNSVLYPERRLDYRANAFNEQARRFYRRHGAEVLEPAFEALSDYGGKEVMRTRYCLRYELDACPRFNQPCRALKEPLRLSDGHHGYLLKFDCEVCEMSLIFLGKKR